MGNPKTSWPDGRYNGPTWSMFIPTHLIIYSTRFMMKPEGVKVIFFLILTGILLALSLVCAFEC